MMTGRIFDIQRFSIHDGPGIRTTVFLKGCPLRCIWCHNPEGMSPDFSISFTPDKCIGCGYCFRTCPNGAHIMMFGGTRQAPFGSEPQGRRQAAPPSTGSDRELGERSLSSGGTHSLNRRLCKACGACTKECHAKALELVGRDITVAEALDEVLRDKPFYETSAGGMTLSGGEPLMQIDFTHALLKAAKDAALHSCVETCGFAPYEKLERIRTLVDLFLYDYKYTGIADHLKYTGVSNKPILANLRKLHESGSKILLRCPIIPGINDNDEHFAGIAALARELPNLEGVELMPYHRLGESKVSRMGLDPLLRPDVPVPDPATVSAWLARLRDLGVRVINH